VSKINIVGGGASGLLVAINLLRKSDSCEVTITEPNEKLGLGLAYSTSDPDHLLNVPAGRMSGLVEEPKSLCEWAGVDENDFISRRKFGEYLDFLLQRELKSGKKLNHIKAKVIDVVKNQDSLTCILSNGASIDSDAVVLALGNSDSIVPDTFDALPTSDQVVRDIWREGLSSS